MKKIVIICVSTLFLVAATGAAFARSHGYAYPRHHHSHRGHGSYHGADAFWAILGASVLAGCLISYVAAQPARTVVYADPEPVAAPPARVVVKEYVYLPSPQSTAVDKVVVTAPELNVRTGPGFNHGIAGYAVRGEALQVIDRAPGWLYVRTVSGRYGWVMVDYTAPQPYPLG